MNALAKESFKAGVKICIESEVDSIVSKSGSDDSNHERVGTNQGNDGWIVTALWLPNRLEAPNEEVGKTIIDTKQVVIAVGGMTDHLLSKVKHSDDNDTQAMKFKTDLIIPVLGQMFRTTSDPINAMNLNHIVCGYDSTYHWETGATTFPPSVTHEIDENTDCWGPRLTSHLYGKQTPEGRFIFGGDRR
jgi:hypothetical protein